MLGGDMANVKIRKKYKPRWYKNQGADFVRSYFKKIAENREGFNASQLYYMFQAALRYAWIDAHPGEDYSEQFFAPVKPPNDKTSGPSMPVLPNVPKEMLEEIADTKLPEAPVRDMIDLLRQGGSDAQNSN
jgi:hypothetical protein